MWAESGPVVSITRAQAEHRIVCEGAAVPSHVMCRRGFRCLRVLGSLDFGETGVLESMAEPLARAGISIFALSTYDTDYLLLPDGKLNAAVSALSEAGPRCVDVSPPDFKVRHWTTTPACYVGSRPRALRRVFTARGYSRGRTSRPIDSRRRAIEASWSAFCLVPQGGAVNARAASARSCTWEHG